jgi:hypothetical protein
MLFSLVVEIENSKLRILPGIDDSFNFLITYMPILNILVVSFKDASESVSRHAYNLLSFCGAVAQSGPRQLFQAVSRSHTIRHIHIQ